MARINNTELTKGIIENAKIQQGLDQVPDELASKVVPVMEVNPKLLRVVNVIARQSSGSTGSTTVYTTPANNLKRVFYLTHINLGYSKDANCDMVSFYLTVQMNGETSRIIDLATQTTTAVNNQTLVLPLSVPIKLDPGSTIVMQKSFTAGTATFNCTIAGFTTDL